MDNFRDIIGINPNSRMPKYKQVSNAIIAAIHKGKLVVNQKIPSINGLSEEFYLSRDTVDKAYKHLKAQNIIKSVRGKGFYISRTDLDIKFEVLFLVNKLSVYKMRIYNSFVKKLGGLPMWTYRYIIVMPMFLSLFWKSILGIMISTW